MAVCKYCLSTHKIALFEYTQQSLFRPYELNVYDVRLFVRPNGEGHDVIASNIATVKLLSESHADEIMFCFGPTWLVSPDFATALINLKRDYETRLHLFVSEYSEKEGLL